MGIEQVNNTNNQSTLKVTLEHFFLFDNRFHDGAYKNTNVGAITLKPFSMVARDITIADGLIPVELANLVDVIGISANINDIAQASGAIDDISYGVKGTIAEELLVLPAGVTLDSAVGNKVLRDILEDIGFHLESATENTKFDNV